MKIRHNIKQLLNSISESIERSADALFKIMKVGPYSKEELQWKMDWEKEHPSNNIDTQIRKKTFGELTIGDVLYILQSDNPTEILSFVLKQLPKVTEKQLSLIYEGDVLVTSEVEEGGHGNYFLLGSRFPFYNKNTPQKVFLVFTEKNECENFIKYYTNQKSM